MRGDGIQRDLLGSRGGYVHRAESDKSDEDRCTSRIPHAVNFLCKSLNFIQILHRAKTLKHVKEHKSNAS